MCVPERAMHGGSAVRILFIMLIRVIVRGYVVCFCVYEKKEHML